MTVRRYIENKVKARRELASRALRFRTKLNPPAPDLSPPSKLAEKKRSAIFYGTRAMLYCWYIKMWPMFSTHIFPTSSRRDSRLPCFFVSARTLSPAGWVERATSRLDKPLYGITRHSSCGPPTKTQARRQPTQPVRLVYLVYLVF